MKRFMYFAIAMITFLCHTNLFGQVRVIINGTAYYPNDVVYLGCASYFSARVEGLIGSTWSTVHLDNYGDNSFPAGWGYTFQPATYLKHLSIFLLVYHQMVAY